MADTDIPIFQPNERVDFEDANALARAPVEHVQALNQALNVGESPRILDGFSFTLDGGNPTLMTIALGAALLPEFRDGATRPSQLLVDGVLENVVDFTGKTVAPHGVWIRFLYQDGERDNRVIWDDVAVAGKVRAVNTRSVAGWQAAIADTSPGAEWVQLYSVAYDGADLGTSVITDKRVFLFEGPADSSPAFTSTWGGGDDRDPDRATNGVKTLERAMAALFKKIEEMQSGTDRWWDATVEPLDEKVSIHGDTMLGDYEITGFLTVDGTVSLGGALLTLSNSTGLTKTRNSASSTGPDPDTDVGVILKELNTSNNAIGPPLFWLHSAVDTFQDGLVLYSKRIAEDDVDLRLATIVDSAFGLDKFIFDMSAGSFTADGDLVAGNDLITVGGASIVGTLVSGYGMVVVNKVSLQDTLEVGGHVISPLIVDDLITAAALITFTDANVDTAVNQLGAALIEKSWGIVSTDGAGGVSIVADVNVASVAIATIGGQSAIRVTMDNLMADVDFVPLPVIWENNAPPTVQMIILSACTINANKHQFAIFGWDPGGAGAGSAINWSAVTVKVAFGVRGRQ